MSNQMPSLIAGLSHDHPELAHVDTIASSQDIKFVSKSGKDAALISYVSPLAVKLAAKANLEAFQVATCITQQIACLSANLSDNCDILPPSPYFHCPFWSYFTIQLNQAGWIYLNLTDDGTARWLERMTVIQADNNYPNQDVRSSSPTIRHTPLAVEPPVQLAPQEWSHRWPNVWPIVWAAQYVHGRTLALLQLADREGLRPYVLRSFNDYAWDDRTFLSANCRNSNTDNEQTTRSSDSYPWMNEQFQLRLQHPSEWELIRCFITLTDEWGNCERSYTPQQVLRHIQLLVQCFEDFYRQCRVFGDIAQEQPELAQARLGLVQITQRLMQILLEQGLGIVALREL